MNKLLKTGLLALCAFPCLVGCQQEKGPAIEDVVKQAVSMISVGYGEYAQTNGISLAGANLITNYECEGCKFDIEYSIAKKDATKQYAYDYVKVNETGNRLEVKIPVLSELPNNEKYAAYVLSGKITYKGAVEGEKEKYKSSIDRVIVEKQEWNIRVNGETVEPVWQKIADARLKNNGETVVTTGYVAAFMNTKSDSEYSNGVWLADGNDGIMLYGTKLTAYFTTLKIGDMVMVIGQASPYNGLFEIKPNSLTIVDATPEPIAPTSFKVTSEDQLKAMTAVNCSDPVIFENVSIVSDPDKMTVADGSAITVNVKVGDTQIAYYMNKHTDMAERQAVVDLLKANKGKTCTLKAVMGYNSSKLQITATTLKQGGSLLDNFTFAA